MVRRLSRFLLWGGLAVFLISGVSCGIGSVQWVSGSNLLNGLGYGFLLLFLSVAMIIVGAVIRAFEKALGESVLAGVRKTGIFNKRVLLIGLPSVLAVVAALVVSAIVSGFAKDVSTMFEGKPLGGYCVPVPRLWPLEDRLPNMFLDADIIAVVDIESVSRGIEKNRRGYPDMGYPYDYGYSKTLEFTFEVEQYLKGAGEDRMVGLVFMSDQFYNTALGAVLAQEVPDRNRLTHWDDRKAVVLLEDRGKDPELNWKAGRYWMAETDEDDAYSIDSDCGGAWLPAASESPDEQTFLLDLDLGRVFRRTITLDELRDMVAQQEQEYAG